MPFGIASSVQNCGNEVCTPSPVIYDAIQGSSAYNALQPLSNCMERFQRRKRCRTHTRLEECHRQSEKQARSAKHARGFKIVQQSNVPFLLAGTAPVTSIALNTLHAFAKSQALSAKRATHLHARSTPFFPRER